MGLFLTFSLLLMPYIEFICVPNMLCCFKNHNVCFKLLKIKNLTIMLFFRAVFIQVFHYF